MREMKWLYHVPSREFACEPDHDHDELAKLIPAMVSAGPDVPYSHHVRNGHVVAGYIDDAEISFMVSGRMDAEKAAQSITEVRARVRGMPGFATHNHRVEVNYAKFGFRTLGFSRDLSSPDELRAAFKRAFSPMA